MEGQQITPEIVRKTALEAWDAGLSVHPPTGPNVDKRDPKSPLGAWKDHQTQRANREQVEKWYANGRTWVGAVTGSVSGNLEILDFDDRDAYRVFVATCRELGMDALVYRIEAGYSEDSPKGVHWAWRCPSISGNLKLASRANGETKIETRGEGGYIVLAPTTGLTGDGSSYTLRSGSFATIATITPEEREALFAVARLLDEAALAKQPEQLPAEYDSSKSAERSWEIRPGDDFNARGSWTEALPGWERVKGIENGLTLWRRPGKAEGWSATTGVRPGGLDLLHVFTSSTPLEAERNYTRFSAYAVLVHGGDYRGAAKRLREIGYGIPVRQALRVVSGDQPGEVLANEGIDDPHRLARLHLTNHCTHPEGCTLVYWNETFHKYHHGYYRELLDGELRAELTRTIKTDFDRINLEAIATAKPDKDLPIVKKVSTAIVANARQALASLTKIDGTITQPSWLTEPPRDWAASAMVPCRNVFVHLPSLVAGKPCTILPTPRLFGSFALDFDFDATAQPPIEWLWFLHSLWGHDKESIETLQEWMGYCLTADTRLQKILALLGPKRSGKGTIARIIRALLGPDNVAGPTLSSLATNFGLAPLIGKPLAVISDARLSGRTDQVVIVERMLSVSGEDTLTVDRKHRTAWTGKLPTRFIILSNELPRLLDTSGAMAGRLIILSLTKSFYGEEDPDLTDRLMVELPGILNWSIDGWKRLQQRGHFKQPASGQDLLQTMEDMASPVSAFIREKCTVDQEKTISTRDLFAEWKAWCEAAGRKDVGDEQTFGRNIHAVLPRIETTQQRVGSIRIRFYRGIGLKDDWAE